MAQSNVFRWHERARLFAGRIAIPHPTDVGAQDFTPISARPTYDALTALGTALAGKARFCISEHSLPSGFDTELDCFLTLTGGSSGQPKVIHRTQASWTASFKVNAERFDMKINESTAVLGRLSHSLALYAVLEALHLGMDAHVLDEMRPREQRAAIARDGITILYVTPTQLRLLVRHADTDTLASVRLILCGGGDLDRSTRASCQALCPNAKVHVFYGAAETSFIALSDNETPIGSVGQAYPGVSLQVRDSNGHPTADIGEVWVQSPYLFDRYLSGASADTSWRDGFVTIGEMGQLDVNGNLRLKGRKARMITIADQNVFPEAVEATIAALPSVNACAVIPIADVLRGHRLIAVIEGAKIPDIETRLMDACRSHFGASATPVKILFHPSMPLLASGKIDLVTLTKWSKGQI